MSKFVNRKYITLIIIFLSLLGLTLYFTLSNNVETPTYKDYFLEEPLPSNRYSTYLYNKKQEGVKDDVNEEIIILPSSFILPKGESLMSDPFSEKGLVYQFIDNKEVGLNVNIKQEGLYQIELEYYPIPRNYTPMEISVAIDGEIPYHEASQIRLDSYWTKDENADNKDRYGNDIAINQVQLLFWNQFTLKDTARLHVEPLKFHLLKGDNSISITKLDGAFYLGKVIIKGKDKIPSYDEYIDVYQDNNSNKIFNEKYEAEDYLYKNDSTIIPQSNADPKVTPFSISKVRLNVLGPDGIEESGKSVSYNLKVEKSGYYYLTFKVLQNDKFTTSYRNLYVNGKVPFKEALHIPFKYSPSWQNVTLKDIKGNEMSIYLEANKDNIITLETDSSLTRIISEHLLILTEEINTLGLNVKTVTGNNQDKDIDWNMKEYFPTIDEDIYRWMKQINKIIEYSRSIYGYKQDSYQITDYKVAYSKLNTLYKDIDEIPRRLSLLSEGANCAAQLLAARISTVTKGPLIIDSFVVHGKDYKVPSVEINFIDRLVVGTQRFISSFTDSDYMQVNDEGIEVWVNRSRQYVELMQKMADEKFTPSTGIKVNMSLIQDEGKLLLANSANRQPDIAMGVSSWIPNEYGMRGAILNLREMEDFSEVLNYYKDEQLVPLTYNNEVYGLPETENFFVLYYRKDTLNKFGLKVPDTWDDVVKMLPDLHRRGMYFYIPLSKEGSFKSFETLTPFIYQFGGEIYREDGLSAKIDNENTIKALTFATDLYKMYSLPYQVSNFFNDFRYNRIPIGVSDFGTYLQLMNAAPEISGLWDISLVPGVKDEESGEIKRYWSGTQTASMIFKKSDEKEDAWDFLKWWMSTDVQVEFANLLTNTYGPKYLWNSANIEAFSLSNWKKEHKEIIINQWEHLKEIPKIPGSYSIERELSNIYNKVVFNDANLRSSVSDAMITIDKEVTRKMVDFGYIDKKGNVLKEFILPTSSIIKEWRDD